MNESCLTLLCTVVVIVGLLFTIGTVVLGLGSSRMSVLQCSTALLQFVAASCRVLLCFAVVTIVGLLFTIGTVVLDLELSQIRRLQEYCSVLQCRGVLQRVAACCSVLQRVAVWCGVLQCVAPSCWA